jgi:hypothetical protein
MVTHVNADIVDISACKIALLTEIDKKIAANLLSALNDDFSDNTRYPIAIKNRTEINYVLDGIDARLRHAHQLKLQFLDTLNHEMISGNAPITTYAVRCTFTFPGTVINREFSVSDRWGYLEVVRSAFQEFILTISSLLENLVRLMETLVRKVIVILKERRQNGTETLHLYREFFQVLVKLEYRPKDDLHACLANYDSFFDRYLDPLYKLRGSFIHGYRENLTLDVTGVCLVGQADSRFNLSKTELMVDQFSEFVFSSLSNFTVDLLNCLTSKISDPVVKIPF